MENQEHVGIIHHRQVQRCVYQSQENVMMEHQREVIRIVAVRSSIDHVVDVQAEQ